MQDGVAENFTAAMLEPYLDHDGCATAQLRPQLRRPGRAARPRDRSSTRAGFQVHFHALGDRAVREALDAVEAARAANGPSDGRHHLAHLQVVHPDDLPRFAELGAVANIQPLWAAHEPQMDELTIPFLGERPRRRWQYPFGDLLRAGARLAAGSDWSVSSPNPLEGIHVAVNRVAPGLRTERAAVPAQQRSRSPTRSPPTPPGSAYVNHLDDATGRIEVGYLADLVVLDRDSFAGPPEEIADASVVATYVEGERVYSAG